MKLYLQVIVLPVWVHDVLGVALVSVNLLANVLALRNVLEHVSALVAVNVLILVAARAVVVVRDHVRILRLVCTTIDQHLE